MHNYTWVCSQSLPITMWEIQENFFPGENRPKYGVKPIQVYDVVGPMMWFTDSGGNACKGYPGEFFRTKEDAEAEAETRKLKHIKGIK